MLNQADKEKRETRDLSTLRNAAQQVFGRILRDLCEASGITQGKLAKEAKVERKRLIEQGSINSGDLIGSMEQPTISRVLAGAQEPTYFQVFIWLRVIRRHYESKELAKKCQELGIEKPLFPAETEQVLWDLTAFKRPEHLAQAYEVGKKIQPTRLSMIEHKEMRMLSEHDTDVDLPVTRRSSRRRDTTGTLPVVTNGRTAV